jgi:hypothetical protein
MIICLGDLHINTSESYDFEVDRLMKLSDVINSREPAKLFLLGDILDKSNPTHKDIIALHLFITNIECDISYISGNHERVSENNYILDDIMYMFNIPKILRNFKLGKYNVLAIGHDEIHSLSVDDLVNVDLFLSHFRWSHKLYGKGELQKLERAIASEVGLTILGDIHSFYEPKKNVIYTSAPYTSKYQLEQQNSFIELDYSDKGIVANRYECNLPSKVRLHIDKFSKLHRILDTLDSQHRYIVSVDVTSDELAKVNKLKLPDCVIRLLPKVHKESTKDKNKVTVKSSKSSILDTLISILPKDINKEYVVSLLGGK